MNPSFAFRLALRESRFSFRRVGVYMLSITLGVAALVSIRSFREDVARSVRTEAQALMGADARLAGTSSLPEPVTRVLDSLAAEGVAWSKTTTTLSMVLAPSSGAVRLLQVQAGDEGFPYYGEVRTSPPDLWGQHLVGDGVLADPAVLTQLVVQPGDTLVVGQARLKLLGTVEDMPTDLGFQTAAGPRVFVSQATLESAGLLGTGSISRHQVFLRLPDRGAREALRERYGEVFRTAQLRYTLAEEQADDLANGIRFLGEFLGLVGLGALLLGGIGVASAIHVYVRERRPGVAVLRCVGSDQWTVFGAYLLQAGALGLLGSAAGVVLGVAIQSILPVALGGVVPVPVSTSFSPAAAAAGLGIGLWVAVIFALIPLLQIRNVPPLQALRQDFEAPRRRLDIVRLAAVGALGVSVALLAVLEAPDRRLGLAFAGALAVAVALLGLAGWGLSRLTRRFFPSRASYPVRQGVSNLFRPQNQTLSVTLALGFGAFIVGTVLQVERNLLDDLDISFGGGRPNVLLFDIQRDQLEGVRALVSEEVEVGQPSDAVTRDSDQSPAGAIPPDSGQSPAGAIPPDSDQSPAGAIPPDRGQFPPSPESAAPVEGRAATIIEEAAIIPSRIQAINGLTRQDLREGAGGEEGEEQPQAWALRREYRNTYRAELGPGETLISGRWWDGTPGTQDGTEVDAGGLARVSMEADVARDLKVTLGDTITWTVAGVEIRSVVTSLREVEWSRLEPNFFAVFEPGTLDDAPQSFVMLVRIPDPLERAAFQRDLVLAFPNVSALDFARVQEAIDLILTRVRQAVAFLGGFSALAGVVVLVGALATSRTQRMREGALLKTLGARRRQVMEVLFSEYLALGTLATATGLLLALGASAILVPQVFRGDYSIHWGPVLAIWVAVAALTVVVGLAGSRGLLRRPPLPVLREQLE
jgi:putative ABC transport system permease protein